MDVSVIPNGFYCYGIRVNEKYINTPYTDDIPFFQYYDKVVCPYWKNIGDGLIQCNFLNKLSLNYEDNESENKSAKYFNGDKAKVEDSKKYMFWDKVKDCDVNNHSIENDFELISDTKFKKLNRRKEINDSVINLL